MWVTDGCSTGREDTIRTCVLHSQAMPWLEKASGGEVGDAIGREDGLVLACGHRVLLLELANDAIDPTDGPVGFPVGSGKSLRPLTAPLTGNRGSK